MSLRSTLALATAMLLAACSPRPADPAAAAKKEPPALLLAAEDLRTVGNSQLASGPVITGSLEPERRADLRAEVAAVVLQVLKDNGEPVRTGDLLVRLDDTAIRESLTSAEEAARAAGQAFDQAERQVQRQKTLQGQGMTSMQALEDAEVRRNSAQSELVSARARVVAARQQLRRTEVRAPFEGVVSDRKVSTGDTAAVGKELVKVIDPRSMRFEGLVSADRMHELKLGQAVSFRVNGFPQNQFTGKVKRIDAAANATTRQVAVTVVFDAAADAPRVAGLFAEGRVETGTRTLLTVPEGSVVKTGEQAVVWRVAGGKVARVAVKLGDRDERTGDYPVLSGLAEGDRILRTPGGNLVDGQKAEMAAAPVAPAAGASAVAGK